MAEYLAPGVYVEEIDSGAKPIEGVSTSTAGMVGVAERGPVNVPQLITSFAEYRRTFGGFLNPHTRPRVWHLPYAVEGFFQNGGKRLWVIRVAADQPPRPATAAEVLLMDRGERSGVADTRIVALARQGDTIILAESAAGLSDGKRLRLDDGASADIVQLANADALQKLNDRVLALRTPLYGSYPTDSTVTEVTLKDDTLSTKLTDDVEPGATVLMLDSRKDVKEKSILRIEGADDARVEYVIVEAIPSDPADLRVTLQHPIGRAHASRATVVLVKEDAAGKATALAQGASAGDGLQVVKATTDLKAGQVVRIQHPTNGIQEYHRLADVHAMNLRLTAYASHPALEPVTVVELPSTVGAAPFSTKLKAINGSDKKVIDLDNRGSLAPGHLIRIGEGEQAEYAVIAKLGTSATEVTLIEPLTRKHEVGTSVILIIGFSGQLKVAATAGSRTVLLKDRGNLAVNDHVRIGAGPLAEYGVIAAVPVAPSDQTITLRQPLARDHSDGTTIVRVTRKVAATTTTLVQPIGAGEHVAFVADTTNFTAGAMIEIGAPGAANVEYQTLDPANVGPLLLKSPLASSHLRGVVLGRRDPLLKVQALDVGEWGNQLSVSAEDDTPLLTTSVTANTAPGLPVPLASTVGIEAGTLVEIGDGQLAKVTQVTGNTVQFGTPLSFTIAAGTRLRTREFKLTVQWVQDGRVVEAETFRQLSLDQRHSRYAPRVIGAINGTRRLGDRRPEGQSNLIRLGDEATPAESETLQRSGPDVLIETLPSGRRRAAGRFLSGGSDPLDGITAATYIGVDNSDPALRTGLHTLKNEEGISLVAIPGRVDQDIQQALIDHCEAMRYRFAVLDSLRGSDPTRGASLTEVQAQRSLYDSKYAALYYPWLLITDPFPPNPQMRTDLAIPPSGHIIGLYAETDNQRGVHKAPANIVISGIRDLQRKLTTAEQELLNPEPNNINVLRDFRLQGRSLRVWGGRCITSDSAWKYINVRRLFIFLEASLDRGLQWVVFEPNAEPLWARVRRSASSFLTRVWRDGALMGSKPEEAYFVKCDRTTMTQDDIDNGRLIVIIGVAPVKPAEFVIVRIGQWAGGSTVEEL